MNNVRNSLQSILLAFYLFLIIAMLGNIIYDYMSPQKNEILLSSIFLGIFFICFISGVFNVFYFQKINKKMYLTFMFYILLPLSIPLLAIEIKYKNKITNQDFIQQSNFSKWFIVVTTILQIIELMLLIGLMLNFLLSNSEQLKTIWWYFLIPICLILFGLVSSWVYFLTNIKIFKFLMIFNFQFGLPWFFLSFILSNENKKMN